MIFFLFYEKPDEIIHRIVVLNVKANKRNWNVPNLKFFPLWMTCWEFPREQALSVHYELGTLKLHVESFNQLFRGRFIRLYTVICKRHLGRIFFLLNSHSKGEIDSRFLVYETLEKEWHTLKCLCKPIFDIAEIFLPFFLPVISTFKMRSVQCNSTLHSFELEVRSQ